MIRDEIQTYIDSVGDLSDQTSELMNILLPQCKVADTRERIEAIIELIDKVGKQSDEFEHELASDAA